MTADDGYADWLRSEQAPDPQELVARNGGYDKITLEAWATVSNALVRSYYPDLMISEGGDIPTQ